ncbi:uncharacterized protein LOC124176303 isoform X1 [Neodiprion fabricii]|uniref:uncharacterized protein LOC124176303 isoform X1 n=1 Tax=Neodiprion fabricii TaxID=2872261 RepID=UPI001ED96268|nr:uncharacterized protein LOC124176303 isoform X1 [Neodiprion fabricii]
MSKRHGKAHDTPSKRARLDITITASQQLTRENKPPSASKNETDDDDPWGADFNDKDIEEMDIVASQSVHIENKVTEPKLQSTPTKLPQYPSYANSKPSTSRSYTVASSIERNKFVPKIPSKFGLQLKESGQINNNYHGNHIQTSSSYTGSQRQPQMSQRISSSDNYKEISKDDRSIIFDDFEDRLLKVNNHNSTFQSQITGRVINAGNNSRASNVPGTNDAINISDDSILRQLEKLKLENQKLLADCLTKEGETLFLRNQLQQTQTRAEHEKLEKARQIEEQANQYRSELDQAIKKEEVLKTQLDFQTLQLNNLKEQCKLLESGSIKFTQPHTASLDSECRNRLNTTLNRSSPAVKSVHVKESGMQTVNINFRNTHTLKNSIELFPLSGIPQSIFEPSQSEPPIVEIQIIEKVGTKNLPILQDEESVRIFENPDLVKPVVTIVNDRKLNIEFCLPDVAILMKKTDAEINCYHTLPMINKFVAVTRELLLNTTLILQRISKVMRNDDIRDMNDVYFSDFYKIHVDSTKSICDSNAWHDRERGIEARRSLAILAYTALVSNYLSEYVAGKIPLSFFDDSNYENYIKQMNSYNKWPNKGCEFEMLVLLLEFVSTVGYVRRSHQFSGLIIAITKLLISTKEKLIHNERSIEYIFKIVKEIIFSRPLLNCYRYITELLMTFSQCTQFCRKLCSGTSKTAVTVWKDELHFTSDACVVQIYTAQLEVLQPDSISMVDITYALVSFVYNILSLNDIAWICQPGYACKCSMKLFELTLHFLCKCSKVNLDEPVQRQNYNYFASFKDPTNGFYLSSETSQAVAYNTKSRSDTICSNSEQLDKNIKLQSKHKQLITIRKGIMFLCFLSTRDPDFIIRLSEIQDSFNLFMQQIESFDDLQLNDTEQAALTSVKSTFVYDKTASFDGRLDKTPKFEGFKTHFELREKLSCTNTQQAVKLFDNSVSTNQGKPNNSSWLSEVISKKQSISRSISARRNNAK